MQIIVRDRQAGKTTELIHWLLRGNLQFGYPKWNRVLVCSYPKVVPTVARMVQRIMSETKWDPCRASYAHLPEDCGKVHHATAVQVLKSVWSSYDLSFNLFGSEFEYVIDDYDRLEAYNFMQSRPPQAITMTGVVVDSLRD